MDIASEIKQQNFFSAQQKVVINVLYTSNFMDSEIKEIVQVEGILPQHFNVLKILKGSSPQSVTPGYLLEVMLDKTRDLTRLVDKLVAKGWVIREPNKDNKRSMLLSLTSKGMKKTLEIEEKVNDWITKNTNLNPEECELLSGLLDKLRCPLS